ncbi:MAG: 2-hydroxychromene-2-carboxylate isomerase [Marinicaulis sp.]|nr:2-hydroxychromene-2-carboxylate isomerase [Marinicaulis sp.]
MTTLEIFYSFRSPYSYLAIDRLIAIDHAYDIDTRFRPVRPLAMREPDFFERGRPQFLPYLFKDAPREAERWGVPFGLPNPDPITMDMTSGVVAPEQPHMDKVMGLAIAAIKIGKGLEFARCVGRSIWGGAENWHEDEILDETLRRAGLTLKSMQEWVDVSRATIAEIIAENEAEQLKHHWGVPLMLLDGEPFFGQDRLDALQWRLDKLGLAKS